MRLSTMSRALFAVLATVVFAGVGLLSASLPAVAATDPASVYGKDTTAFSVGLPSGWRFQGDEDGFAQFSGPSKSFFWVQRYKVRKAELGPNELVKFYTSKGYALLYDRKATTLSGLAGGRFILAKTDAGVEWRYDVTDVFTDGGMQWVVFAVAPRATFAKLVDSSFAPIYSTMRLAGSAKPPAATAAAAKAAAASAGTAAKLAVGAGKAPAGTSTAGASSVPKASDGKPVSAVAASQAPAVKPTTSASVGSPVAGGVQQVAGSAPPQATTTGAATEGSDAAVPKAKTGELGRVAYESAGKVWLSGPSGDAPVSMGEGRDPSLAAGGQYLAYKGPEKTWTLVALSDGKRTQVALDAKASHVVLSPDGTKLAYSVSRKFLFGPASFTVRVVDLSGKVLHEFKTMDVPSASDSPPGVKSPQADSCANPHFGANSEELFLDARVGGSWSVVKVDLVTATAKLVVSGGEAGVLSPDGRRVAYTRVVSSVRELWACTPDGRTHEKLALGVGDYAWLPDGSGLIVEAAGGLQRLSFAPGSAVTAAAVAFVEGAIQPTSSGPSGR